MGVVELGRSFEPARDDPAETDRTLIRAFARASGREPMGWKQLLELPRVVLLGEAGSGKTAEMRFCAAQLNGAGCQAFFAPIEHAAAGPLFGAIETENAKSKFAAWLQGTDTGWLFLDSVDESRLKGLELRRALLNVQSATKGARDRIRIIVSCRVSDWQPNADRDLVAELLPVLGPQESAAPDSNVAQHDEGKPDPRPSVFVFVPLNTGQVKLLASRCCGVADPDRFWQAIEDAQLEAFTTRPRDVRWLAQYWRRHGNFGRFTEMVEENIQERLKEHNLAHQRQRDIDLATARHGAVTLAAATAFCRELAFLAPDRESLTVPLTGGMLVEELLPDWLGDERDALLSRALFDPATYGRVRFHHRTVADYLAAEWLERILDCGVPPSAIENLYTVRAHGHTFIDDALAPVAAWLAGRRSDIRQHVRRIEPEILIQHGDPGSLPEEERLEILRQFLDALSRGEPSRESITYEALERFSTPGFGPAIARLMAEYRDQPEALILLVRVARHARLGECVELVFDLATSVGPADLYAIYALEQIGTPDQRRQLAEHAVAQMNVVEEHYISAVLEATAKVINSSLFVRLVEALDGRRRGDSSTREYVVVKLVEHEVPPSWLIPIVEAGLPGPWTRDRRTSEGQAPEPRTSEPLLLRVAILALTRLLNEFFYGADRHRRHRDVCGGCGATGAWQRLSQ